MRRAPFPGPAAAWNLSVTSTPAASGSFRYELFAVPVPGAPAEAVADVLASGHGSTLQPSREAFRGLLARAAATE